MKAKNIFSLWLVLALCLLPGQAAAVSLDAGTFYIDYIKPRPSGLNYVDITGYYNTTQTYNMTEVDTQNDMCMANITAHTTNTSNPHGVTASQLTITDGDVPNNITIDNATNADTVDNLHASNTAGNVPVLDSDAKLPTAQIPFIGGGFGDGSPVGYYTGTTGTDVFHWNEPDSGATGTTTYVKEKQITLTKTPAASLKISFEMNEIGSTTAYGRIYRNGVAVGTEQSTPNIAYIEFTEVIGGWSDGDTLELWVKTASSP